MFKNDIVVHKENKKRYIVIDEFIVEPEGKMVILKDTWSESSIPKKVDKTTLLNEYYKIGEAKTDQINSNEIKPGDLVTHYNTQTCKYDTYPVIEIYICESSDKKEYEGKRMYVLNTGEARENLYISEYALYGVVKCLK